MINFNVDRLMLRASTDGNVWESVHNDSLTVQSNSTIVPENVRDVIIRLVIYNGRLQLAFTASGRDSTITTLWPSGTTRTSWSAGFLKEVVIWKVLGTIKLGDTFEYKNYGATFTVTGKADGPAGPNQKFFLNIAMNPFGYGTRNYDETTELYLPEHTPGTTEVINPIGAVNLAAVLDINFNRVLALVDSSRNIFVSV